MTPTNYDDEPAIKDINHLRMDTETLESYAKQLAYRVVSGSPGPEDALRLAMATLALLEQPDDIIES